MKNTKRLVLLLFLTALLLGTIRLYQKLAPPGPSSQLRKPEEAEASSSQEPTPAESKSTTISIRDHELQVELAQTPEEIARGLSGRERIVGDGLLFIFESPNQRTFWMKEMRFSIDLLWIADGQIIGLEENLPPSAPGIHDSQLATYPSPGLVSHVLELPSGKAQELGIKVGDQVLTTDPSL